MRRTLTAVALTLCTVATGSVWAHGGRPVPRSLYVEPDNTDFQTLISSDLGLHVTTDAGNTWHWICEDVVGFDALAFALAGPKDVPESERAWLVGSIGISQDVEAAGEYIAGFYRSTDGGCNWAPTEGILATQWVSALSVDPADPNRVIATTRHITEPNGIAISEDAGLTWRWSNIEGLPEGVTLGAMTRSISDPTRLYASGSDRMLRSEDNGETWTAFFEELVTDPTDELRVHTIDPEDPDVLYFSLLGLGGRHLYVTEDAGMTSRKILEPSGLDFSAVVVIETDDEGGREILVGDAFGTAFSSKNGGESFEEYLSGAVSIECLQNTPDGEGLYICSNPFAQFVPPIFAVGTSTDGARTIDPYFTYANTTDYLQCDDDSQIQKVCVALLDLGGDDAGPDGEEVGPGEDVGVDAGLMDAGVVPSPTPEPDCGCETLPARNPAPWPAALLVLVALMALRERH